MIDNDIADRLAAEAIVAVLDVGRSAAETHVANRHVMRVDVRGAIGNAHAIARSGLTGNGDVWGANVQRPFQMNHARHVEYNNPRTRRFTRFAKRTGTFVIETGDDVHFASSAANGESTRAFRAGERRDIRLRQVFRLGGAGKIRLALRGLLQNDRLDFLPCFVFELFLLGNPFLVERSRLRPALASDCCDGRKTDRYEKEEDERLLTHGKSPLFP